MLESSMPPDLTQAPQAVLAAVRLVIFDFDGVFTDNTVWVSETGQETVRCCRSDGIGVSRLRGCGVDTGIVSTEVNPVVSKRAEKLRLRCIQGCPDKAVAVREMAEGLGIPLPAVAFVGNDVNDLPALALAGLKIAVADAYPDILAHVTYRTLKPGGFGAVREVCDAIASAVEAARENPQGVARLG